MMFKLKNLFAVFSLIIPLALVAQEKSDSSQFQKFLAFIDDEKAQAVKLSFEAYDEFLEMNFGHHATKAEQTKAFLELIQDSDTVIRKLVLPKSKNEIAYQAWEESGLRSDVRLYEDEDYHAPEQLKEFYEIDPSVEFISLEIEPIEVPSQQEIEDSSLQRHLSYNRLGLFAFCLQEFSTNSGFISVYLEAKDAAGDFPLDRMAKGLLATVDDFDDPFLKLVVIADIYFWLMK